MELIAITGGIGSGKSVVSRMMEVMGYNVYDCDSRAKGLMTGNNEVRQQLISAFGQDTYLPDGNINRDHLSTVAFADDKALSQLNAIVHPATARDMQRWAGEQEQQGARVACVETALLRTAGLDKVVDQVWHVTAPAGIRIDRVMKRSGLTATQVEARIASQSLEDKVVDGENEIVNDGVSALLPQVMNLLQQSNNEQ